MVHLSIPNTAKELLSSLSIAFTETPQGLLVDYAHIRPHLTGGHEQLAQLIKSLDFDSFVFSAMARAEERVRSSGSESIAGNPQTDSQSALQKRRTSGDSLLPATAVDRRP